MSTSKTKSSTRPPVQADADKANPTPAKPVSKVSQTKAAGPRDETGAERPTAAGVSALRKRELIERVVQRSGVKKRDAKPVVEAMLAEMGEALADNRDLVLPSFGRAKVNRQKTLTNGQVIVVKIRQTKALPPSDPE